MPQSLKGISILIDRDFTEQTADWIWRLVHCKEVWKEGGSNWCEASATEISDCLLDHRDEIGTEISQRLGSFGFDADLTLNEWLTALARIQDLARSSSGICRWVAGELEGRAEEVVSRILSFLDRQAPPEA